MSTPIKEEITDALEFLRGPEASRFKAGVNHSLRREGRSSEEDAVSSKVGFP